VSRCVAYFLSKQSKKREGVPSREGRRMSYQDWQGQQRQVLCSLDVAGDTRKGMVEMLIH
jgi:hypothetical protein